MKKTIYLISIIVLIFSCAKKTQVSGRALSRYNYPLNNYNIVLGLRESHSSRIIKQAASTDNNGYFSFNFKAKKNTSYFVQADGDSGKSKSYNIKNGQHNDFEIEVLY